jgi:alpha-amylase
MFSLNKILPLLSLSLLGHCLTPAQWRQESIYQVITDRFARTDGSTTAACNINDYCGGTWQGLINKLDYIQGMGFTAVRVTLDLIKTLEKRELIFNSGLDLSRRQEYRRPHQRWKLLPWLLGRCITLDLLIALG